MTDKELRKLSRLELLELLLKESKENQMLKDELEKLKNEKSFEKTTEQLKETAIQFDASLQNADALVNALQKLISTDNSSVYPSVSEAACFSENDDDSENEAISHNNIPKKSKSTVDVDIYRQLMLFYAQDITNLDHLPAQLHIDVAVRLAELLKK